MSVLDVGCGTGAITRGAAEAIAPGGYALGVDINADLIAEAGREHADVPGLGFRVADIAALPTLTEAGTFDIATAARVLQWLADPLAAIRSLAATVRRDGAGRVLILDYNHEKIAWSPEPPAAVRRFYDAFLQWRADAGMDNAIADHLRLLLAEAGLREIETTAQHERTERDAPGFAEKIGLWGHVAEVRGPQMVRDGYLTETERGAAIEAHRFWAEEQAESQTLYLLSVEGVV